MLGVSSSVSRVVGRRSLSSSAAAIENYDRFLNARAGRRIPSLIRELSKPASKSPSIAASTAAASKKLAVADKETIFMAGGLPNPSLFPFESLSVSLGGDKTLTLKDAALKAALQYQPTLGYPPLHETLKKLVVELWAPPAMEERELIVTAGSQNGLAAVLDLVVSEGDAVVVPVPVYPSVVAVMAPFTPEYLEVPEDEGGVDPEALQATLTQWYAKRGGAVDLTLPNRPKLMYVNPTGANPSGAVISTERKRRIYEIARSFDLLILEDDPYYFLHFLETDPVTFLSIDTDRRVLRFDSVSKVLSSGLRVGFVTGPSQMVRALELSLQASVLHAPSVSQVLVDAVLRSWGVDGLHAHARKVRKLYRRRRDLMVAAAEKHLGGVAEWVVPQGGMFLWIRVKGVADTHAMVMERGAVERIMLLPGSEFMTDRKGACGWVRASYSVVPEERIEEGMERLGRLVRAERTEM